MQGELRLLVEECSTNTQKTLLRREFPAISQPKGGGAIHDTDEKLQIKPATDSGKSFAYFDLGWEQISHYFTLNADKDLTAYLDAEESVVFFLSCSEETGRAAVPVDTLQELFAGAHTRTSRSGVW